MRYGPITHFTDIEAWKLARKLRVAVYSVIKELPTEERYDLASQIKSCYDFMKLPQARLRDLISERLKFLSLFEFIPRCKTSASSLRSELRVEDSRVAAGNSNLKCWMVISVI